jgi:hypothetical protein
MHCFNSPTKLSGFQTLPEFGGRFAESHQRMEERRLAAAV